MKFIREKIGMLTILLLILMKGTDGPPVPPNKGPPASPNTGPLVPPNTGPPVPPNKGPPASPNTGPPVTIKACAGEDEPLLTKDESAQEDILSAEWIFRKGNASNTTANILCNNERSGRFKVNPLYSSKVEQCNTTSILLKNISSLDEGYYTLHLVKERIGSTDSLPIFLSVSDTPTKRCKPDISHSGNMLNCSTQCEQFDVEWTQNKGDVVGNGNILLVDCLPKNEPFLCCIKSKDMECYKGDRLDLCEPIPPNYCTENRPGENVPEVHADKVPDNPGSNMLGLLALLIILVILVAIYVLHRKEILPNPTMCRDRSIPCCSVSAQEPHPDDKDIQVLEETVPMLANGHKTHADDKDVHVPEDTVPMVANGQKPHADDNDVQVPEDTVPMVANGQKPHADDNDVQVPEDTVPMVANGQKPHADDNDVQVPETPSPILGTVQELDVDVKLDKIQENIFPILDADGHQVQQQDTVHEIEAGTELQEFRNALMCKICFNQRMNMVFIPCNHMATCKKCSSALGTCPICRAKIEKTQEVSYE